MRQLVIVCLAVALLGAASAEGTAEPNAERVEVARGIRQSSLAASDAERAPTILPYAGHALRSGSDAGAPGALGNAHAASRWETLWIFDADFSDLTGDNAGWATFDESGTPPFENFWHKDTLFTAEHPELGDSAWWCGTVDPCFEQGQGYGNDWICYLERDFPLGDWSNTLDRVRLEFDHRYALEKEYDYAYVDISDDGGATWETLEGYSNSGFPGQPGNPVDWNRESRSLPLGYSGEDIRLRFRVESDAVVSSEDQDHNPQNSFLNGAWQIDNIEWLVRPFGQLDYERVWLDDCEAPGDNGWEHDVIPGVDQTDVAFARYQFPTEIGTNRLLDCNAPVGDWVMAAVYPANDRMVDGQDAWLVSPAIDIAGVEHIVAEWEMWVDCPRASHDYYDLYLTARDDPNCTQDIDWLWDTDPSFEYGGGDPAWGRWTDDWSDYAAYGDWLGIGWRLWDEAPALGGRPHMGGIFLNRQRVGVVTGPPSLSCEPIQLFRDWFGVELGWGTPQTDEAFFRTSGEIEFAQLVVESHGMCYPVFQTQPGGDVWRVDALEDILAEGEEYLYYFEAWTPTFEAIRCPANAPDELFEFSLLPLGGEILLVDAAGGYAPGQDGDYAHEVEYYYEEALEVLGHTWDRFDIRDHTAPWPTDIGPSPAGMGEYETIIWFTGNRDDGAMRFDLAKDLYEWLLDTWLGEVRNLIIYGNDVAFEVVEMDDDSEQLYEMPLACDYIADTVDDTEVSLCDAGTIGGPLRLPRDCSVLLAGCPQLPEFDILDANQDDASVILYYETSDATQYPAAVAHSNSFPGYPYQTVTYGFGLEYVGEGASTPRGDGGLAARIAILGGALEYLEVPPSGPGTGIAGIAARNALSVAYPNPANPRATIEYSVKNAGRTRVRIYDASGKLVRTLLDAELPAGASGRLVWDGRTDAGEPCASGVYFYRIDAPKYQTTKKLVLLK